MRIRWAVGSFPTLSGLAARFSVHEFRAVKWVGGATAADSFEQPSAGRAFVVASGPPESWAPQSSL